MSGREPSGTPGHAPPSDVPAVTGPPIATPTEARFALDADDRFVLAFLLLPLLVAVLSVVVPPAPRFAAVARETTAPVQLAETRADLGGAAVVVRERLAAVSPDPPVIATSNATIALAPTTPDLGAIPTLIVPETTVTAHDHERRYSRCSVDDELARAVVLPGGAPQGLGADAEFGWRLALAAEAQLDDLVVYSDRYQDVPFPMGDVPALYGVCTDVVIRAYRSIGIDLQRLVHAARVGSGDKSIDHRRTEVLRRFFELNGKSLTVSDIADDYLPGDVVTYYRPQNSGSQYHIAIVSTQLAPSGRPLIVHNRGWGPQLEDALFVNRITGHYRYALSPLVAQDVGPIKRAAFLDNGTAQSFSARPQSRLTLKSRQSRAALIRDRITKARAQYGKTRWTAEARGRRQ